MIDASISVDDKSGALSDLSISWVQAGLGGWPYVWRTDLHPIYMIASFHEPGVVPAGVSNFDPAKLRIKIEVLSARKIRHPLFLRLWREGQDKFLLGLGGPAEIPAWRKSAQVTITWADLADYAKGDKQLRYELARLQPIAVNSPERIVSEGRLDLSNLPRLFEEFRAAERELPANVAARRDCTRNVEPDPESTGDQEI